MSVRATLTAPEVSFTPMSVEQAVSAFLDGRLFGGQPINTTAQWQAFVNSLTFSDAQIGAAVRAYLGQCVSVAP